MRSAAPVPHINSSVRRGQQAVPAKMGYGGYARGNHRRAVHTLLIRPQMFVQPPGNGQIAHALAENLIHDLGAPRQRRHDLMPVHKFRRRRLLCPASPAASVITRNCRRTL